MAERRQALEEETRGSLINDVQMGTEVVQDKKTKSKRGRVKLRRAQNAVPSGLIPHHYVSSLFFTTFLKGSRAV